MPVIDAQGRVFGRFNLVDTLVVVLLVAAIPAGYGAHLLFRDPPAQLSGISPAVVTQSPVMQVSISGENLRPYMRVSFGNVQAPTFLFYGPTSAFVPLPALAPGTYDVVLFDYMREVARLPNALTIVGALRPPSVKLHVSGAFTGLAPGAEAGIAKFQDYTGMDGVLASVLSTGPARVSTGRVHVSDALTVNVPVPEQREVPATLTLTCPVRLDPAKLLRCWTGEAFIAPDVHVTLTGPHGDVLFRVEQIEVSPSPPEGGK